ncbi:hypothetical protein HDU92_003311 [Lobulomyces angularis]|nr:hypothetical protein HDU92_003311 [Lobulomyces angularis]
MILKINCILLLILFNYISASRIILNELQILNRPVSNNPKKVVVKPLGNSLVRLPNNRNNPQSLRTTSPATRNISRIIKELPTSTPISTRRPITQFPTADSVSDVASNSRLRLERVNSSIPPASIPTVSSTANTTNINTNSTVEKQKITDSQYSFKKFFNYNFLIVGIVFFVIITLLFCKVCIFTRLKSRNLRMKLKEEEAESRRKYHEEFQYPKSDL